MKASREIVIQEDTANIKKYHTRKIIKLHRLVQFVNLCFCFMFPSLTKCLELARLSALQHVEVLDGKLFQLDLTVLKLTALD